MVTMGSRAPVISITNNDGSSTFSSGLYGKNVA
jgi:hypothetical protein